MTAFSENALLLDRRQVLKAGLAAGLAASMPAWASAADPKSIRIRLHGDIQILDPARWLSHPEAEVMDAIYSKLITYQAGSEWKWELDAAESIEEVDATHIKFKLKPGLMWSNDFGEITAEDVKFSYERYKDPKTEASYASDWEALDHVEVIDKYSGVIVLKEPFAPLWTSTLPFSSGTLLCKKAVEGIGGKVNTEVPASYGPYVIKEWTPKQRLILARNPAWQGAAPFYDEVVLLPIPDEKAAEIAYKAGEVECTQVGLSSVPDLQASPPAGSALKLQQSLSYVWLGLNVEHEQFKDERVRKAVSLAFDIDAVLMAAYFGVAQPATGLIPTGLIGHRTKPVPARDVEAAKALLAEAGLGGGFKTTLSIENRTDTLSAAQIIQASLAEVGIEVEIDVQDGGAFWSLGDGASGERSKKLQMTYKEFTGAPDPAWSTQWFTPDQIGIWNWERWNSPEFAELHKQGLVERDSAKREEIYQKMGDLMAASYAYNFTTYPPYAFLFKDTIEAATLPNGWQIFRAFRAKA
ncbi:MAG: peptide ABC transporter substrate-binding protein [Rhizobiaceae bacterium]|nr:peptide ABC transporter substrate-binding protein [Rhizobiaceae bacterium]